MTVPTGLADFVRQRAGDRCEYCRMSQALQGATFHIEHVVPITCGGSDDESNLALACPSCNLHKSDRSHAVDVTTGELAPLFHPRRDRWPEHLEWKATTLIGTTPIGRATIHALELNHPRRLKVRDAEALFGLFSSEAAS